MQSRALSWASSLACLQATLETCAWVGLVLACGGCSGCGKKSQGAAPSISVSAIASGAPLLSSQPRRLRTRRRLPSGPRFAILAGQGVGPIRIGATTATIERLMGIKCEELTDKSCRFIERAVEFELQDGVTQAIRVHRTNRPAGGKDSEGNPRTFGVFNGGIPPDLLLFMLPSAIKEGLGEPKRVEKPGPNEFHTEELHYYDGMILEYDRVPETGKIALGGVRIVK